VKNLERHISLPLFWGYSVVEQSNLNAL